MRLSEAIRLGAMALPEIHGPLFEYRDGKPCAACALGCAYYAIGRYGMSISDQAAAEMAFPLLAQWVTNPANDCSGEMMSVIIHLFETYGWTREEIADWIDTLEAAQPEAAADPVGAAVEQMPMLAR